MNYSQYCDIEIGEHRAQGLHLRADAFLLRHNRIHSRCRQRKAPLHGCCRSHRVFCGFGPWGQLRCGLSLNGQRVEWVQRRSRL